MSSLSINLGFLLTATFLCSSETVELPGGETTFDPDTEVNMDPGSLEIEQDIID